MAVKKKPTKKKTAAKRRKPTGAEKMPASMRPYMWKKGQSGNPAGRPPGNKALAKMLRDQLDETADKVPAIKVKADKLGLNASKSSIAAVLGLSMINDAVEGKGSLGIGLVDRVDGYGNSGLNKYQVLILAQQISDVINQEVQDPLARARIADRIGELVGKLDLDKDDG